MKLRLSQQEDSDKEERPTSLSLDFFSSLMASESKRKGVFQILSFNRKRQRVYSCKLNDGFFILKVMLVNEAAQQLQKGLIKSMFILQGSIRNHGEGVIVVKEELKYWQYFKQVGEPIAWKLKKENVNFKGSNFVMWSTQKMEDLHKSPLQVYAFQLTSQKKPKQENSLKFQCQSKMKQNMEPVVNIKTQVKLSSEQNIELQTQPILQQQKIKTPQRQNNEQRFQTILQFLLTDDDSCEEETQVVVQPTQQRVSTNRKKLMERTNDLKFIFNCLTDQQEQVKPQLKPNTSQVVANSIDDSGQDSDYDLIEWMRRKRQVKEKEQKKPEAKKHPTSTVISFEDLYHGFISSATIWEAKAIIKCINRQKDLTYAVICDLDHKFPIHAIFINKNQSSQQLQQNQPYRIGKGTLKNSVSQKINSSNFDIQFDFQVCILSSIQEQSPTEIEQPCQNYCLVDRIYELQEGLVINCYGVLRDYKIFKAKSTNILNLEVVDPLSKWSVTFIQFDALNSEQIKDYLDKPITIFGAAVSSYKNKKNLMKKPFTIIKYDWLPLTLHAKQIKIWTESNNINLVDTELVGYTQVADLAAIEQEVVNNFYLPRVVLMEFKSKYSYKACSQCFKKVKGNRCRTCGFRKSSEIEDRLFLRGDIGDESAIVSIIFSSSLAESMLSKGLVQLKKKWLLRNVSVWIDRGSNGSLSIVRLRQCSLGLQRIIKDIKRLIL